MNNFDRFWTISHHFGTNSEQFCTICDRIPVSKCAQLGSKWLKMVSTPVKMGQNRLQRAGWRPVLYFTCRCSVANGAKLLPKWCEMVQNRSKLFKIRPKLSRIRRNRSKMVKMFKIGPKWYKNRLKFVKIGIKWTQTDQNRPKTVKLV